MLCGGGSLHDDSSAYRDGGALGLANGCGDRGSGRYDLFCLVRNMVALADILARACRDTIDVHCQTILGRETGSKTPQ